MIKKNNIQGEVQSFNNFEIYAYLTENSNVIRFEDETSIERMSFLSTGDQIIGKAIPDDVFIESIDIKNHNITVSQPMDITMDETIKVLCKVQFFPKDNKKDFFKYRIAEAKKKKATNENVFEHFINNGKIDEISDFIYQPTLDISNYRDTFLTNLQNQSEFRKKFNKMCNLLYKKNSSSVVQPSTFNCEGDLFFDINAYTNFEENGKKYIMSQKVLDYFENYKDEVSRISDNTKIGVSINGYTNNDEFGVKDKNILSKFRKTKKWGTELPFYIKIGTGCLPDSVFEVKPPKENAVTNETYYNDENESYYNHQYYSGLENSSEVPEDILMDIDKPLFSVQLGEYEILNNLSFQVCPEKTFTAVQFAVMRRVFNNYTILAKDTYVFNKKIKDLNIFSLCLNQEYIDYSQTCNYCGEILKKEEINTIKSKDECLNYCYCHNEEEKYGTSYYVYNDVTKNWEHKECIVSKNSINTIKKLKDRYNYIYFIPEYKDTEGNKIRTAILFLEDQENEKIFSYYKNLYYNDYIDNDDVNNELNNDIELNLNITDMVKGSLNSTFILRENLFSSGYEYSEDGTKVDYSKPVDNISLTEDYIYCDEENEVLYTYNGNKKLMIFQENNKYFKNIINNVVKFEKEKTFSKNGLVENYFLREIDGFNFDVDLMSLNDRILSIEKIGLRNKYDVSNEPVLFSNFQKIKTYLRGFFCDNENGILDLTNEDNLLSLNFGYKFKFSPQSSIQKSKTLIEEKKLKPYNKEKDEAYEKEELIYGNSTFNGEVVNAPKYIESTFTDEQNIIEGFEYYKNLLVLEGSVDLHNPTRIFFENKKSLDALSDIIATGDEVLEARYLAETPDNGYGDPYDQIENVVALDWKNEVFLVAATDALYFFSCNDIESFSLDLDNCTKIEFKEGDILTSIVWDNVDLKWIYTLELKEDNSFAGCYSIVTTFNGNGAPLCDEPIQEFNQSMNSIDVNTYQFIKPLKTTNKDYIHLYDTSDVEFADDERILTRDFAIRDIDENLVSKTLLNTINEKKVKNGQSLYIDDIIPNDYTEKLDYLELEFDAVPQSGTIDSLSVDGGLEGGYYIYDRSFGKWRYSNSEAYSFIAKNFSQRIHAHVIFVNEKIATGDYLYQNGSAITVSKELYNDITADGGDLAQFLWLLPRPSTNKNECFIVCVTDDIANARLYSSYDVVSLRDITVKTQQFITDKLYDNEDFTPHYVNGFYADYGTKRIQMAYNYEGYIAALNGDTLFIKSPTAIWESSENDEYGHKRDSETFMWKKAQIPCQKDLSYKLFDNLSPQEAFELVCQQKTEFIKYLKKLKKAEDDYNLDEVQQNLLSWLEKNDSSIIISPEKFLNIIKSDEAGDAYDYTNGIILNGIEFLPSTDGSGLYANINESAKQQYVVPQNLAIQGGKTVNVYVREQTYYNYLRDYYEIILGSNRLSNIVSDGVKSMKLTSNELILVTKTDDVLTLPLQYTNTRDNIENYNNWEIKSLAPAKEVPSFTSYSTDKTFTIKYGITDNAKKTSSAKNYAFQMQSNTHKLYHITCSYVEKNIQIYGGYYQFDEESINFYLSNVDNLKASDFTRFERPFVVYSDNGGKTFEELECDNISGFPFAAYNSRVAAIYKVGNVIRVSIIDENKTTIVDTDFNLELVGSNYLIANNENYYTRTPDEKEYKISDGFVDAGLINSEIPYAISDKAFFLAIFSSEALKGKIVSKDLDSITISPYNQYSSYENNYVVPVLISIYTVKSVRNPWDYLNFEEKYFTGKDDLKVRFVEQVSSKNDANLLYSKNETLSLKDQDKTAITCFANDVNKTVYKYYENYEGYLVPSKMTNSLGEPIILYDVNNKSFLLKRNPENPLTESLSMKELIKNSVSLDTFINAYDLNENYTYLGNDFGMINFFNSNKDYISFNKLSFNTENPFINILVKENESTIADLIKKDLFYEWPAEFNNLSELEETELSIKIDEGKDGFYAKLKELVAEGNTITKDWLYENYEKVQIVYNTEKYDDVTEQMVEVKESFFGIREKSTNTILTNELVSEITFSSSYESYNENTVFYGHKLLLNENKKFDKVENYSISSICLGNKGYGSSIETPETWDIIQPYEYDKKAFESILLKNDLNKYVYLCDKNGTLINMRNGQFDMSVSDEGTISYDNLAKEENIVKVYKDEDTVNIEKEPASTIKFYKIPESDLTIYSPQDYVSLTKKGTKKILTILRPYYSDVDMSSEERITFSCPTKLYSDKELQMLINDINIYYENGVVYYDNKDNDKIYTAGNSITFVLTDTTNGKTCERTLELTNDDIPTVTYSPMVFTNEFIANTSLKVDKELKSFDLTKNEEGDILFVNNDLYEDKYNFKVVKYNNEVELKISSKDNGRIVTVKFDMHKMNAKLYLSKIGQKDSGSKAFISDVSTCAKVYSNELDITDLFDIKFNKTESTITATYKNIVLTEKFDILPEENDEDIIKENGKEYFDDFVFTQLSEPVKYTVTENSVICGLFGKYILNTFKYDSFRSLIIDLERKITYENSIIYDIERNENKIELLNLSDTYALLDTDLSEYGNTFVIKILPVQTVYPDVSTMNNSEYFTELKDIRDIKMYGYDRVWINKNICMEAPFEYEGQSYNSESMSQYSVDTWKNKDGFKIWLSDEKGRFIKPKDLDGKLYYYVVGNEKGDCSEEIYQSHEVRINPCELLYKTMYDAYKDKYYLKGVKVNPFLKKIRLTSLKEDNNVIYKTYFFNDIIKRNTLAENRINDNSYLIEYDESNFIDYENKSTIKFKIYGEFEKNKNDFVYFNGIKYNNIYKDNTTQFLHDNLTLESNSNFIIDSTEDIENKEKSTVEDITEMGIFSKNNVLLAYMTHPKCQYDTKKNYIAYNLLIED